mgnify:CR=1 FL=1
MEQGWFIFLEIMLINIVLSGDNAVVIAMASRNLPPAERRKAVWWGSFGAVALRLLLTGAAVYLIRIPYVQAAGSLLLLYIAVRLTGDHSAAKRVSPAASLLKAVWTIVVADFIMSLDNVLAVAAIADGSGVLTLIGVGLSIPLIVWGSTLIMRLLDRFPLLIFLGAALLGYTAGEMAVKDREVGPVLIGILPALREALPFFGAAVVISAGLVGKLLLERRGRD